MSTPRRSGRRRADPATETARHARSQGRDAMTQELADDLTRAVVRSQNSAPDSPTRTDPVVASLSQAAGGPVGFFLARGAGTWRALPVLVLLAALTMCGALLTKQHCRDQGWSNPDQFWHACYSDTAVLYSSAGLGGPERPSLREAVSTLGQSPVQAAAMWLVSAPVHSIWGTDGEAASSQAMLRFFDVSAVLMTLLLIAAVIAIAGAVGQARIWDAGHVAMAPILLSVALVSYELLAVALLALTLWAWSRRSPVLAGGFLALAIGAHPVTLILAPVLLALGFRSRRSGHAATTVGVALLGWFLLRWALFGTLDLGIPKAWDAWRAAGAGYGSIWLVPQLIEQSLINGEMQSPFGGMPVRLVSVAVVVSLSLVTMATGYFALTMRYRPRLAHLALFAVAMTLLSVKAFPPQASLILIPLVAASALKWRDHLIWATTEIGYFVAVWLYIAGNDEPNLGLPAQFYLVAVLLRSAGVAWLAIQAVRMMYRPSLDPVRVPLDPLQGDQGDDDPAAGVLVSAAALRVGA